MNLPVMLESNGRDGRLLGCWPETGFQEVGRISNDKSAYVDRFEDALDDEQPGSHRLIRWSSGNPLVLTEFASFKSGDVKGTIRRDMRLPFVSNVVRRHRLISISYISLLPCHGTARWYGRDREDTRGNRAISEGTIKVSHAGA
jgi:hypothetical protein